MDLIEKANLKTSGWLPSGGLSQIPELIWNEIFKQVNIAKGNVNSNSTNILAENTRVYSTLIASEGTAKATGYGVQKTSSKLEYGKELYYGHLTEEDIENGKLAQRFKEIADDQTVTTNTETRECGENRKV